MTAARWVLIAVVLAPLGLVFMNRVRIDLAALLMAVLLGTLLLVGIMPFWRL